MSALVGDTILCGLAGAWVLSTVGAPCGGWTLRFANAFLRYSPGQLSSPSCFWLCSWQHICSNPPERIAVFQSGSSEQISIWQGLTNFGERVCIVFFHGILYLCFLNGIRHSCSSCWWFCLVRFAADEPKPKQLQPDAFIHCHHADDLIHFHEVWRGFPNLSFAKKCSHQWVVPVSVSVQTFQTQSEVPCIIWCDSERIIDPRSEAADNKNWSLSAWDWAPGSGRFHIQVPDKGFRCCKYFRFYWNALVKGTHMVMSIKAWLRGLRFGAVSSSLQLLEFSQGHMGLFVVLDSQNHGNSSLAM